VAIDVGTFKGEAPRIAPRLLPNDMGQNSANARLISGNLESWKNFSTVTSQGIVTNPVTIYYLADQVWLTWNATQLTSPAIEVDVAKMAIAGDKSYRTIFTGTDVPRFTDIGLSSGLTGPGASITFPVYNGNGASGLVGAAPSGVSNLGTGDFTVEAWVYTAIGTTQQLAGVWNLSGSQRIWQIVFSTGGCSLILNNNATTINSGASLIASNTWTHLAVVRKSGVVTIYFNGVSVGTGAYASSISSTAQLALFVNNDSTGGPTWYVNGNIKDLRISNVARYSTTFVPLPPNSMSTDSNTIVLMQFNGANGSTSFPDAAGNFVPSALGTPTIANPGPAYVTTNQPVTGSSTLGAASGPYPTYSRKLGVPNPTVPVTNPFFVPAVVGSGSVSITETFDGASNWNLVSVPGYSFGIISITGGNPGACLQTRSIGNVTGFGWKTQAILNTAPITMSVNFAVQRLTNDYLLYSYIDFYFSLDTGGSGSMIRLHHTSTGVQVIWQAVNNGAPASIINQTSIASASISTWQTDTDPNWTGAFRAGHWYTASFTITPASPVSTSTIAMTISDGSTVITAFTLSQATMPNAGSGFGMGCMQVAGQSFPDWAEVWYDNLQLSGTGPASSSSNLEYTSYVYTVVNDLGLESGPCPAMITSDGSGTLQRPINQAVCVPLPSSLSATGVDSTYFQGGGASIPNVNQVTGGVSPSMNVYRAVTGSTGTAFLLVATGIGFGTVTQVGTSGATVPGTFTSGIVDALPDAALVTAIASTAWYPPPVNMQGILALPNGIYAGFAGNQLCLSAQGVPHAWPIAYRLTFDWDIVGIEAIDSTVVVCTKKFPYLCSGQTPDQYSQTKASYAYACASKQSIQYLKGVGVVFATFEGLVAIAAPGSERLLTETLFTKDEWLALNPASMMAVINDNRYFCFYTISGGTNAGFYLDVNAAGSGKVSLAFHAIARYNDPLTDTLYLVLDSNPTP